MIGLSGRKLIQNTFQHLQFVPRGGIWERIIQIEFLDKEFLFRVCSLFDK